MANSIQKGSAYVPFLDEVYAEASLTADLDGNPELVKAGASVDELIIPKMDMAGLGDYSRNSGYTDGDVTMVNETVKCNFDRGRRFNIDEMDNEETAGLAYGRLAGEFIRTKVAPEIDAFRFSKYASKVGVSAATPADLKTGEEVVKALRAATNKMDEDEVPMDGRLLYITPTLLGMVEDMDTIKSKSVLANFEKIVKVPQTRFYSKIDQFAGKADTEGDQKKGGYKKATAGKNLNFLIVQKGATIQYPKHIAPQVIPPEINQQYDGYTFKYRNVGICDVYANKVAGIYKHEATK